MMLNIFQLFIISILAILVISVFYLVKYSIKRQKYCNIIPTVKLRFTNVLGHLSCFPFRYRKTGWNGHSLTTYIMEIFKAFSYLFKKEHVAIAWLGYFPLVLLNSPEAVEELLSGSKAMEKAIVYKWLHCIFGTGLVTSHGKKWKRRRKQLTPAFHFDILRDFLPVINEKSQELVKILETETTKEFTNIEAPIQLCALDISCQTSMGVNINTPENNNSDFVKSLDNLSEAICVRFFNVLNWFDFTYYLTAGKALKKDLKLLYDYTNYIIQEKKKKLLNEKKGENENLKQKQKPLIDLLLELQIKTNDLTEENVQEEVATFTIAGNDTISTALTWVCYLTGLYKDIQAKAHEELDAIFGDDRERPVTYEDLKDLKYIENILKESLRLYPAIPAFARKAERNMIICGYPIPENSTLLVCSYMLHRNEEMFPNPEKFDPDRFTSENSKNRHPYAYIPFSAGPRNCIGQRYAMMELKILLSHILRHYTLESLEPRDKVLDSFHIFLKPTKNIRIKIRPRIVNVTKD